MFRFPMQTQAHISVSASSSTYANEQNHRSTLKISIKTVSTKPLTEKLQALAERYRRLSDTVKGISSTTRRSSSSSVSEETHPESSTNTTQKGQGSHSNTASESCQSSVSSEMSSRTSSQEDLSSLSGNESDSVFIDVEATSTSVTKSVVVIPPAPPLPTSLSAVSEQSGDIPPAPPLPSASIPVAPPLPQQTVQVKMAVTTHTDNARSQLMEQIRAGVKLKPVSASSVKKSPTDTHTQLMQELLGGGTKLRKTSSEDIPLPPPLPKADTAKSEGGRNALLSEIGTFDKSRLRKTGKAEHANTAAMSNPANQSKQHANIGELLLSDDLLQTCIHLSADELDALSKTAANYLVTAAEVDIKQVVTEATRHFTHVDILKTGLQYESGYVRAFCEELLKYADCYKEADIISPESPKGPKTSVIDVAIKRLESGRSRLFSTENQKGARELKKGEAILESAIKAARAAMTDNEKSALMADNVKQATFNILCELPWMEGFETQNGKAACNALRSAFFAAVSAGDNAKDDIANFMKDNLANGFSNYTFTGLSARLAKLEAQLAKLAG